MTTECYETSLLLFANARGVGTLLTVKCPAPRTHRETNAQGLPGGCSRLELTHTLQVYSHVRSWSAQRESKLERLLICNLLPINTCQNNLTSRMYVQIFSLLTAVSKKMTVLQARSRDFSWGVRTSRTVTK